MRASFRVSSRRRVLPAARLPARRARLTARKKAMRRLVRWRRRSRFVSSSSMVCCPFLADFWAGDAVAVDEEALLLPAAEGGEVVAGVEDEFFFFLLGEVDGGGVVVAEDFYVADLVDVGAVVGGVGEEVSGGDVFQGAEPGVVVSGEEGGASEAREGASGEVSRSSGEDVVHVAVVDGDVHA